MYIIRELANINRISLNYDGIKIRIEKNTVSETLVLPLGARKMLKMGCNMGMIKIVEIMFGA